MAHFHLAWELGGGHGHTGRLKMIAQALVARGHQVSFGLRDLGQCFHLLADLDAPKVQAPIWQHRPQGLPPGQASLAEILLACGYLEARGLAGMVDGWRHAYRLLKPDLVVADYAPTAIVAARSLGIRSAAVGIGFSSPPPGRPLPCLRPWENLPAHRLAVAEARVLQSANAVLAHFGAQPYRVAADMLAGDRQLLNTWPELDHCARPAASAEWHGPISLPGAGAPPQWPHGAGPQVFVYVRAADPSHLKVLAALARERCRVLCYLPEMATGMPAPVVSPNIAYAPGPVAMDQVLAVARCCVLHSGDTTAQSLQAGVPVMLLPTQLEQFLVARRVAESGLGINAATLPPGDDWRAAVRELLQGQRHGEAARAFAARHAGHTSAAAAASVAGILEALAG